MQFLLVCWIVSFAVTGTPIQASALHVSAYQHLDHQHNTSNGATRVNNAASTRLQTICDTAGVCSCVSNPDANSFYSGPFKYLCKQGTFLESVKVYAPNEFITSINLWCSGSSGNDIGNIGDPNPPGNPNSFALSTGFTNVDGAYGTYSFSQGSTFNAITYIAFDGQGYTGNTVIGHTNTFSCGCGSGLKMRGFRHVYASVDPISSSRIFLNSFDIHCDTFCSAGTYADSSGVCSSCPAGSYQSFSGQDFCNSCTSGSYCPQGASAPVQCQAGTYFGSSGGTSQSDCTTCPIGNYCPAGASAPTPCGSGSFQDETGQGSCKFSPCNNGLNWYWGGANHCTGQGSTNSAYCLSPCASGCYCPDGDSMFSCPAGSYCPGSTSAPIPCPAGSYCPSQSSSPTPCNAGSFLGSIGGIAQSDCSTCPAGSYCPQGASSPTPCDNGNYCLAGSSSQTPCPYGGSCQVTSCAPQCNQGYYCAATCNTGRSCYNSCDGGLPVACPVNTFQPSGAGCYSSCQTCPAHADTGGYTGSNGCGCIPGAFRSAGGYTYSSTDGCTLCPAGSYQDAAQSSSCKQCTAGNYCPSNGATAQTICPAGNVCSSYGATTYSPCRPGYYCPTGASASSPCPAGTFRSSTGGASESDCSPCPGNSYSSRGASYCDTYSPTVSPTLLPSVPPSPLPSHPPVFAPTDIPTNRPTTSAPILTVYPTAPSVEPSADPTTVPSSCPSATPSAIPTSAVPTKLPSPMPSSKPSYAPSSEPSAIPTKLPTTAVPSTVPSQNPTYSPTIIPSAEVTGISATIATSEPTLSPSFSSFRILISSPYLTKASLQTTVVFYATILSDQRQTLSVSCEWSLGNNTIDSSVLLTKKSARSFYAIDRALNASFPLGIALSPSYFSPGQFYTFRLTAVNVEGPRITSTADMVLYINKPPRGGSLDVSPLEGYALETMFTVVAALWQTDIGSYPLRYSYSFVESATLLLGIGSDSSAYSISTTFPLGAKAVNYSVTVQLSVVNADGASASACVNATVLPSANMIDSVLLQLITANLSSVNKVMITLNNRDTGLLQEVGSSCHINDTCSSNLCIDFICASVNKVCRSSSPLGSCSRNGKCSYIDALGTTIDNCLAGDSSCVAICLCDPGFAGSGCEQSIEAYVVEDGIRGTVCSYLQSNSDISITDSASTLQATYSTRNVLGPASAAICSDALDYLIARVGNSSTSIDSTLTQSIFNMLASSAKNVYLARTIATGSRPRLRRLVQEQTANSISRSLGLFTQQVLDGLVLGQSSSVITDSFQLVLSNSFVSDLFNSTVSPGNSVSSMIRLPATGLSACTSADSNVESSPYSLMQWLINPYPAPAALGSNLLRWSSPGGRSNGSEQLDQFILQMAYETPQILYNPSSGNLLNYTVPTCSTHTSQGSYLPCDCSLVSYNNLTAIFTCPVVTNLCPSAGSALDATLVLNTIAGQTSDFDVREYGVLFRNILTNIPANLAVNPFQSGASAPGVFIVVAFWLFVFIGGVMYFKRWDSLDRVQFFYVPSKAKKIEAAKGPIIEYSVLVALRERLNNAFIERSPISADEDFVEHHVEFQRRDAWVRFFSCILSIFAPCKPMDEKARLSVLIGGSWIPRFTRMLAQYHPYLWFFGNRSLQKTRLIRFITTLKSILVTIFISTLFFDVYYPDDGVCSKNYTTEAACLSVPSRILSGTTECVWNSSARSCSLRPPPSTASFIITVSILTTIVFAPFDLLFYVVLNSICSRRPDFSLIGIDSFMLLGSEMPLPKGQELPVHVAEGAINSIMRYLHYFELRIADKQCDAAELQFIRRILRKFGLYLGADGKMQMTFMSGWRHGNIRTCVGAVICRSYAAAESILTNANLLTDERTREAYLLQLFILEHFSLLPRICIRRQFLHYTSELPLTVHPIAWITAWLFIVGSILFFIVWILQWGTARGGLSVGPWVVNFFLSLLQEIFAVSFLRIFFINVLFIELLRPTLRRIRQKLAVMEQQSMRKSLQSEQLDDTHISRFISPVCIAAAQNSFEGNSIAELLATINDKDSPLYPEDTFAMFEDEADVVDFDEESTHDVRPSIVIRSQPLVDEEES